MGAYGIDGRDDLVLGARLERHFAVYLYAWRVRQGKGK